MILCRRHDCGKDVSNQTSVRNISMVLMRFPVMKAAKFCSIWTQGTTAVMGNNYKLAQMATSNRNSHFPKSRSMRLWLGSKCWDTSEHLISTKFNKSIESLCIQACAITILKGFSSMLSISIYKKTNKITKMSARSMKPLIIVFREAIQRNKKSGKIKLCRIAHKIKLLKIVTGSWFHRLPKLQREVSHLQGLFKNQNFRIKVFITLI